MNTNVHAIKDRLRGVRAGRYHMGGEQYRRDIRAALHELQQRLGQCHQGPRIVRVAVTAGPAPSQTVEQKKIVPEAQQFLHRFYFLRSIVNAEK